jgi:hypothetical protein
MRFLLTLAVVAAGCSAPPGSAGPTESSDASGSDASSSSTPGIGGGPDAATPSSSADASALDAGVGASANCSTVPPATRIVDGAGDVWTLVASNGQGNQIARNGVVDPVTHEVILLLYENGVVYQENADLDWWSWTNASWVAVSGDPRVGGTCGGGGGSGSDAGLTAPPPAAAAGFHTLVYNQGGAAGWNIDTNATGQPGYALYPNGFGTPGPVGATVSNGILSITNGTYPSAALTTATGASNAQGYVGNAFGGGFYTEAAISLDPSCVNVGSGSWPAFWGEPVEKSAKPGVTDQWPSQAAGYEQFVELDFMEFWGNSSSYYQLSWWGIWDQTCASSGFCVIGNNGSSSSIPDNGSITPPPGIDWKAYNVFGAVVVPSGVNGAMGYTYGYLNDALTSSQNSWGKYDPTASPPPSGNQIYSVVDVDHYYLILGTTANCPMNVAYVRVWQRP